MTSDYTQLAEFFKILAHPVRLQILAMLRHGEICVCHIEAALGKRQAYISQQLMALREAGVVESRKDGLQVYYRLAQMPLLATLDTLLEPSGHPKQLYLEDCRCPSCSAISPASMP